MTEKLTRTGITLAVTLASLHIGCRTRLSVEDPPAPDISRPPSPDLVAPRPQPDLLFSGCRTDGVIDSGESDVDCGGSNCPPCAVCRLCADARDCASGRCSHGRCAAAALKFAPTVLYGGRLPVQVIAADLDSDGAVDLVIADWHNPASVVRVFLGDGHGVFASAGAANVGVKDHLPLCGLAAGDLDEDGILDLVVTFGWEFDSQFGFVLMRGDGNGRFLAGQLQMTQGACSVRPAIGDLDRDGHLDLVAAGLHPKGMLSVLRGRGDGTFMDAIDYPAGRAPCCPILVDFDHDGWLDVAIVNTSPDSTFGIYFNDGRGGLGSMKPFIGAAHGPLIYGDLNHDGFIDLHAPGGLLLGHGTTFTRPAWADAFNSVGESIGTNLADYDVDGDLDVSACFQGYLPTVFSINRGRGDGTFEDPKKFSIGLFPIPDDLIPADFDGDCRPDIALVGHSDVYAGYLIILRNVSE